MPMASAEGAIANGESGASCVLDDIACALRTKRKQLEKEVRDFTAQKDREYTNFEQELHLRREERSGQEILEHKPSLPGQDEGRESQKRPDFHRRDSSERRKARPNRTALEVLNQAFRTNTEGERELEGFITPEYLGLIDCTKVKSKGNLQPPVTVTDPEGKLSSSVTIHPPLLYPWASSPVETQPVSSSAPEHSPQKSHHRSDSSNSILSVSSLRSSMKDPKTPKSPKRVLFSIEDGVVSPSTSPTLQRKPHDPGGGDAMESMLTFAKRGKEKKKKTRRRERGDGERGRRGREDLDALGISETSGDGDVQQLGGVWTKAIPIMPGKAPHTNGLSKLVEDEAFEKISKLDDDELFAFDEDLGTDSISQDVATSSKEGAADEDELDTVLTEPLTVIGTSPHAGSLPIEIKWPGRRDSAGAGG